MAPPLHIAYCTSEMTPFAKTGKVRTVIKSVSKKQRPRSATKRA